MFLILNTIFLEFNDLPVIEENEIFDKKINIW